MLLCECQKLCGSPLRCILGEGAAIFNRAFEAAWPWPPGKSRNVRLYRDIASLSNISGIRCSAFGSNGVGLIRELASAGPNPCRHHRATCSHNEVPIFVGCHSLVQKKNTSIEKRV